MNRDHHQAGHHCWWPTKKSASLTLVGLPSGEDRMAAQAKWRLSGDYFENCNCDVVCPCLVSPATPMTARPTQGVCDVALFFHIDQGRYDQTSLDGLNVAVVAHTPGPMAD